ncbi:AAA family ATPase [Glutamicibacter ardleyensis]|uniref:AAA family ATPase n=1 Tax=Glutamicibacter ardleyensis TaxID=225894 RepID=UPI003FD67FAE
MILSFAVRNFRSFANDAVLSLTSQKLRTVVPPEGTTWIESTERIAAIFGPNASGKSTVLDAILAVSQAIRRPGYGIVFQPTKSRNSDNEITEYELSFIHNNVRYRYEIGASSTRIEHEALYSYPKKIERKIFIRSNSKDTNKISIEKGDSLTGPTIEVTKITKPTMLFLSTALKYDHDVLAPIARTLAHSIGINHISFRDRQDESVLKRVIMEMVAAPDTQRDLVKALIQAADLGIEKIEIRSQEIPAKLYEQISKVVQALEDGNEFSEEDVPKLRDVLVFVHRGQDGHTFELPVKRESSGTITWLTTAWHALQAMRQGSILLIDEIDASLHPDLVRYIVQLFLDPNLNHRGAQLIFTTHDVSLLGNSPVKALEQEHVWFVEKSPQGSSELYSLADFDNRNGNNSERRYLAGTFGAIPKINDGLLHAFISEAAEDHN